MATLNACYNFFVSHPTASEDELARLCKDAADDLCDETYLDAERPDGRICFSVWCEIEYCQPVGCIEAGWIENEDDAENEIYAWVDAVRKQLLTVPGLTITGEGYDFHEGDDYEDIEIDWEPLDFLKCDI